MAALLGACAQAEVNADGGLRGAPDSGPEGTIDAALPRVDGGALVDAAPAADAPVSAIDARPPADAGPGGCSEISLLVNGAFDNGPGAEWVEHSGAPEAFRLVVQEDDNGAFDRPDELPPGIPAHTPLWAAWLAGYDAPAFSTAVDRLHQDVDVPAGTTRLVVRGRRWFQSEEIFSFDEARLRLLSTTGSTLETYNPPGTWLSGNITRGWESFEFVADGSYGGQMVRVQFDSVVDSSQLTRFFFDSLEVIATVCSP